MLIVLESKYLTYERSIYQVLMDFGLFLSPKLIEYVRIEDETIHIGVKLETVTQAPTIVNTEDNARW